MEKNEVVDLLKNNICNVSFRKQITGELRTFRCTLNSCNLPEAKEPTKVRSESKTDAIRVYEVDLEAWRSFNLSNLESIEIEN